MAVMNNFCQSNDKIEIKIEIQHTIEQSTLYSGDHKSFLDRSVKACKNIENNTFYTDIFV